MSRRLLSLIKTAQVHQADRITDGVTGIHVYLNTGKRSSMVPAGDNVSLAQISDLSGNFLDADISPSGVNVPMIQEDELNGQSILVFDAGEGDDLVIGTSSDHKFLHNQTPHRIYQILNLHDTPTSSLYELSTRSGGATSGYYTAINATSRTVTTFSRANPAGKLYDLTSTTGLSLDTWYKIETHYRGYNHATLNDAELIINDTLEDSVGTSFNRSSSDNSEYALEILGSGTLQDTDWAFLLLINDSGKSDATIASEDSLIQDVISNLFGI